PPPSIRHVSPPAAPSVSSLPTRRSSDLRVAVTVDLRPEQVIDTFGVQAGQRGTPANTPGVEADHVEMFAYLVTDDERRRVGEVVDRKSTRLNSSHVSISYAVFCLKKKTK